MKNSNINRYLEEIGKISIYTKEEEREFFKKLEKKSLILWDFIFRAMYNDSKLHLVVIEIFSKRTTKTLQAFIREFNEDKISIDYIKELLLMIKEKEVEVERKADIDNMEKVQNNIIAAENINDLFSGKNKKMVIFTFIKDCIMFLLDNLFYFDGFIEFKLAFEVRIIESDSFSKKLLRRNYLK